MKRDWTIQLILFVLVFLAGALGQVPRPHNQTPGSYKQSQSQDQQSQGGPVQSQTDTKKSSAQSEQRPDQHYFYDFTLTDAVQAIFAVVLGIVAVFQFLLMKKQNALIDRQNIVMEGQTTHMESGLELTRESIRISKDALEISEGADLQLLGPIVNIDASIFPFGIRNIGHKAATSIRVVFKQKWMKLPATPNTEFIEPEDVTEDTQTIPLGQTPLFPSEKPAELGVSFSEFTKRHIRGFDGAKDVLAVKVDIEWNNGFGTIKSYEMAFMYRRSPQPWLEPMFIGTPEEFKKAKEGQRDRQPEEFTGT